MTAHVSENPVGIRAVVITVSDACSRGERQDESGAALLQLLEALGAKIIESRILSDDLEPLAQSLREFAERSDVNLILTTGGTGLGPRDNTPEATQRVIEREAPGIAEAIRAESLKATQMAMLSRGVCGVCSGTLIINLPGSPKAVKESFSVIAPVLRHALDLLAGRTRHS
jgi:molybdopterin adenylyltransferase